MPDIFVKNIFLLLCMNWMNDKKLLQKSTDIYMLQCLQKEVLTFAPKKGEEEEKKLVQQIPISQVPASLARTITFAPSEQNSIAPAEAESISNLKNIVHQLQKELKDAKNEKSTER